jgi:hypothetical protein
MSRTQLDEHGGAAAERTGNSGQRPKRAQRAGIMDSMRDGHHNRRCCHAAGAKAYAERTVTGGGEHPADHTGRPVSGS